MEKKSNQDAWYINLIMGVIILITAFFISRSYYDYLSPNRSLPSGKGGKLGLLVIKHLDNIGGKPLVLGVMIFIALLCFWWAYHKYKKGRR